MAGLACTPTSSPAARAVVPATKCSKSFPCFLADRRLFRLYIRAILELSESLSYFSPFEFLIKSDG